MATADESIPRLLLTRPQAARALGISLRKLDGMNDLPVIRIGRSVRFPQAALVEYVKEQTSKRR